MSGFRYRGVIEGYYGPSYRHEDRLWWLERLGRWGMNLYVYAPKDDALQRSAWRTPYPEDRLREFAGLVEAGARSGVELAFSVSPGLSIEYSSHQDLELLIALNRREQTTLVLVTHDHELACHADRRIQLFDGRIVGDEAASR